MTAPRLEIERKFLLDAPPDLPWETEQRLRQGYLALDGDTEVRIRGDVLTIKSGSGLKRVEEELPVGPAQADALWELTRGRRVEKVRRTATVGGVRFEVDAYSGHLDGLLVAEVEFLDEPAAQAFVPPPWLGREVTHDKRYANRSLAVDGRPEAP